MRTHIYRGIAGIEVLKQTPDFLFLYFQAVAPGPVKPFQSLHVHRPL